MRCQARIPKLALFAQFAAVAKALAHPHRLDLLEQLAQGERSVEVLADRTGLSIANASQHLQHMRRAGLRCRPARRKIRATTGLPTMPCSTCWPRFGGSPSRTRPRSSAWCAATSTIATAWSRSRAGSLLDRLKAGLVTVLDVRPEDEFALGHVPGAINIPLGELERAACRTRPRQEIVAYCRGPYCVLSYEAVAMLRARGFKVRRLEDGLPEWRAAGLPVAVG